MGKHQGRGNREPGTPDPNRGTLPSCPPKSLPPVVRTSLFLGAPDPGSCPLVGSQGRPPFICGEKGDDQTQVEKRGPYLLFGRGIPYHEITIGTLFHFL